MIPFYKELLYDNSLTPNERIVYSYLIYKSITYIDSAFTSDGSELDINVITETLENERYIAMHKISYRKLADELCMSPRSIIDILSDFKFIGIIDGDDIHVPPSIVNGGYFPLHFRNGLNGKLLIFYSCLKSKSKVYGGIIPQKDYIQYKEMNISRKFYQKLLCELSKDGYMERTKNGKLKIN